MSSSDTPKTVLLRGEPLALEGLGTGAIIPGHILERDAGGTVSVHSSAGGRALFLIAREEEYVGGTLDTAYASGDNIPFYVGRPGDQFYAILEDGHNVAIGTLLESAGDGTLQIVTTSGSPICRALEAVNTSGGATATARIRVEVL